MIFVFTIKLFMVFFHIKSMGSESLKSYNMSMIIILILYHVFLIIEIQTRVLSDS